MAGRLDAMPFPSTGLCCGSSMLVSPNDTWSRRAFVRAMSIGGLGLACSGAGDDVALGVEAEAKPSYAPLAAPLTFSQVPGVANPALGISYTLGHPAVPDTTNEGHTSNAGFIVTEEGVVVFDALGTPSLGWAMLQQIRAVTDKPVRTVVLSHYHADHIYGLQAFRDHTDATILAQANALDYTAEGSLDDEKAGPRLEQRRQALSPWVDANTRIVEPETVFQTATELKLGSRTFRIIFAGPAHSMSDSMMLVLPDQILFAGDIVQNGRIPFMASAAVNSQNWLKGLAEVAELKPRFIIPGHGRPSENVEEAIAFTRDYILYLREVMSAAVESWTPFEDAYAAVDWSRYAALPAFSASNRGNAYRVFLELEHKSFE